MAFGVKRNRFRFHKLTPNPSRGDATLSYELAGGCDVKIEVFDVAGRSVTSVSRSDLAPGVHDFTWDSNEGSGPRDFTTGAYFVRLTARNAVSGIEEFSATRKLILIR